MKTVTGRLARGTTSPAPRIECWAPEQGRTGTGLIILPGGGYGHLAEHEGKGYAECFSKAGIACFVAAYRLGSQGHRHPAMLEDALAAIETVRSRAGEFGVDPRRLGIMGSSAGGHLAAHALGAWRPYEARVPLRPDFGVLCYPVIASRGPHAHKGSMRNLAGHKAPASVLAGLSCEALVSADTPPCFIWHTCEDAAVPLENSLLFASALRKHNVPFELHIYAKGAHGLGLDSPFRWEADCLRWIGEVTGDVMMRPAVQDVRQLKGLLHKTGRRAIPLAAMQAAVRRRGGRLP